MLSLGRRVLQPLLAPAFFRSFSQNRPSHATLGLFSPMYQADRLPLVPTDVHEIVRAGHQVLIPHNAIACLKEAYQAAGARIVKEVDLTGCDAIATIDRLALAEQSIKRSEVWLSNRERPCELSPLPLSAVDGTRADSIDTATLASDFAVRDGTITACLAMQLGRHAVQQALVELQSECARQGAKGRVDTLARKPEQVLRKVKKGKSIIIGVIGDTGAAQGACAALNERHKVKWIAAKHLRRRAAGSSNALVHDGHSPKIYACLLKPADYLVGPNGTPFDQRLFDERPECFTSVFDKRVAPYITLLIHAAYPDPRAPSLLSSAAAKAISCARQPAMIMAVGIEAGLQVYTRSLALPGGSMQARCSSAFKAPFGNMQNRLYFDRQTQQQRTFSLGRLATFFPLDLLEQHSRMLTPHILRHLRRRSARLQEHRLPRREHRRAFARPRSATSREQPAHPPKPAIKKKPRVTPYLLANLAIAALLFSPLSTQQGDQFLCDRESVLPVPAQPVHVGQHAELGVQRIMTLVD